MTFVLINRAPDGRHVRAFKCKHSALQAIADWFGHPLDPDGCDWKVGRTYASDWGNRLTIEERPDKFTARDEEAFARAYDARECGVATKRQLALLERRKGPQ